ncbi:YraN family protein [Flavobacterium sp. NG2]|uniref:YraN family protein n=1 Tax=Flavobacterium sp. NG2 TaxID=3097547 RepID=UPI002A801FB4|nr:YraN family protein [Flavobacterium sp. NG2]WPR72377.1 YraN family protein [Flavobacterium sp. NG2]
MAAHNELGKLGEEMAVNFLKENGYTVLDRNWRFQKAEIDIVCQKNETLAIVEVKTRSSIEIGLPIEAVNSKKIRLLTRAVDEYVCAKNLDLEVRFDVISIHKDKNSFVIEHLTDAFFHF